MRILDGFAKVAGFANHSDGTEFSIATGTPAPYEPMTSMKDAPKQKPCAKRGLELMVEEAKKTSTDLDKQAMAGTGALDYVGTSSDTAPAVSEQLKWTFGNNIDVQQDKRYDKKTQKFVKALQEKTAMKFVEGFQKTAAINPKVLAAWDAAKDMGKSFAKGFKSSGGHTVGDTLKLKGLGHLGEAAKANGGIINTFEDSGTRARMAEALGKAAPSLAVGTAYAAGAKKVYDKTLGNANSSRVQAQAQYGDY